MNQIVKDKMQREIMVIKNEILFGEHPRETKFYWNNDHNFEKIIVQNYEYMVRWVAEQNYEYKQPIPYGAVVDDEWKIFIYKRGGSSSNAWESRLHEKISFWIGWHIEREDEASENILVDSLIREVEEEVNIKSDDIKSVEAIWYINDEESDVSKVHFWVCYVVNVHNSNFELLDWELDNWEFLSIETIEEMIQSGNYDLENWAQIFFEPLKKYLSK